MLKSRCLVLVWIVACVSGSRPDVRGTEDDPYELLKAEATLERSGVVLYEPVVLSFSLVNRSASDGRAITALSASAQTVRVWITHPNGDRVQWRPQTNASTVLVGIIVEPGNSLRGSETILDHHAQGVYAFPRIGRYAIHVEILVRPGTREEEPLFAVSDPVHLQVHSLTEVDRRAIESLGDLSALRLLQASGPRSYCEERIHVECLAELKQFVNRYGASSFAPFVAFNLIRHVSAGLLEDVDQDEGIALSEDFLARWSAHPLARQVARGVVYRLVKEGRLSEASHRLEIFRFRWPEWRNDVRGLERALEGARAHRR